MKLRSIVSIGVGVLSLLVGVLAAHAGVELMRESGAILDKDSNKVKFENVKVAQDGELVRVSFDYSIWAQNNGEIDQLLVSVNGKVVEFVFDGIAGNRGKSGRATVRFSRSDYPSVDGKHNIEIGFCEDYGAAQAKQSYESPKKGGYRIVVGYVE